MAFSNTTFCSVSKNNSDLVCSDTHGASPQGGENTEPWLLRLLCPFLSVKCQCPVLGGGGGVSEGTEL